MMGYSRRRRGSIFTRGPSTDARLLIRIWIASVVAILAMYGYMIKIGQFGKLWNITIFNFHFYLILFALWAIGLIWWKKHEEFSNRELLCFALFVPFSAFPCVTLGFLFLTDLGDVEVLNGYAQKAEHTERYYTESEDEDGNVSRTWHGPYYTLHSSVGEVVLTRGQWESYIPLWGGRSRVKERKNWRADGPWGAGIQSITWNGEDETKLPVSVYHRYVNYVKGSDSAAKRVGAKEGYEEFLRPYPKLKKSPYGTINFDRVVTAKAAVTDPNFVPAVDKKLDMALRELGARRQVNVLVYIAGTEDQGLYYALEEFWSMGKKNDVCVVIGYTQGMIRWSQIMAYTKNELFKEHLASKVRRLEVLEGKGQELAELILTQITSPGAEGYQRLPMADYAYLASGIKMPIWASILVVLVGAVFQLPTIWLFLHN